MPDHNKLILFLDGTVLLQDAIHCFVKNQLQLEMEVLVFPQIARWLEPWLHIIVPHHDMYWSEFQN